MNRYTPRSSICRNTSRAESRSAGLKRSTWIRSRLPAVLQAEWTKHLVGRALCGTSPLDSRCVSALSLRAEAVPMHNEFTAVFERDGDWYVAYSPEIPGANGQGRTKEEARESLAEAIALILADRREDGLRGVPPDAERETVIVR